MKFYLINPKFPDTFWGFRHVANIGGYRYAMANLALPTVAAMISQDHEVTIVDENIEEIDFETDAEVIGLTGFNIQSERMYAIADFFRQKGKLVVIGGPYASLCPEECAPHADVLIVGEAEGIWPQFLADLEDGQWGHRYEEKEKIDITTSPIPRWDLLKIRHYGRIPVQTTRGCPFSCEFCDVIVYLGQKVRQKRPEQVCAELDALYPYLWKAGRDSVFFADDNFIGNKGHAKNVCRQIIELNRSFKRPLRFSTQVTINLAKDKELLELMAEANFQSVFIGIETPNKENLLDIQKPQNMAGDMIQDVRTVQSYGLFVWAGMIVGFDNDTQAVFKEQLDFINEANIPISMTGMLNAPANTPLWSRLHKEGRLLEGHQYIDQADTNIIPKRMTAEELRQGYARLMTELYSYENYEKRLKGLVDTIEREPSRRRKKPSYRRAAVNTARLAKMIRHYLLTGDRQKRNFFVSTVSHILKKRPHYLKEGLWHLAVHKHFHEYSHQLAKNVGV
ncbi:MAG: B12-binding domain-containing radical SAM protein [Deltaproteobacteria bacterium]|nr:B12-binding domain-containing radical SAM protein [Deltaproteobacteria bacterium]